MKEYANKLIFKLKHDKKIYITLAFLILFGVIGVTFAVVYFNTEFVNKFNTSTYSISIEEEFYDEWGTKRVSFVNNDTTPVVIRVAYIETWSKKTSDDETILHLSNKLNGVDTVTKDWTESWNNDFVLGNDGWYYYNKVLKENEAVQVLNSINLNKEVTSTSNDNYNFYDYNLDFNYEAIQATNRAIQELWGHNVTINGGDIIWDF